MALKKPSQAAKKLDAEEVSRAADQLADQMADKPYGALSDKTLAMMQKVKREKLKVEVPKAKSMSISLPPEIIEQLEDQVRANKRADSGAKTISGILREILEDAGYTGATIRNR